MCLAQKREALAHRLLVADRLCRSQCCSGVGLTGFHVVAREVYIGQKIVQPGPPLILLFGQLQSLIQVRHGGLQIVQRKMGTPQTQVGLESFRWLLGKGQHPLVVSSRLLRGVSGQRILAGLQPAGQRPGSLPCPLEMMSQDRGCLIETITGLCFQCLRDPSMQQGPPSTVEIVVDHLTDLVVAEVVVSAIFLHVKQLARHQILNGIQKHFLIALGDGLKRSKVESAVEHGRQVQDMPHPLGDAAQPISH